MGVRRNLKRISAASCLAGLCLFFLAIPFALAAKPVKTAKGQQVQKERLVLMPLRLGETDKNLQGAMETALVEGLQRQYEVLSGEQVARKAREIFQKESRNTAKKECDETRCLQGITEAFNSELLAIASVTKQDGGYFLALSIRNLYDNIDVYSKSLPCRGCDSFQAVEKIKELVGTPAVAEPDTSSAKDPESALWNEVQKGNTIEDYEAYLAQYAKGKFAILAKSRIKKFQDQAASNRAQQDQAAWESANGVATEISYQEYLNNNPNGQYASLAQARIAKLKREAAQARQRQDVEARPAPAPTQSQSYVASASDSKAIATVNGVAIPQLRMDLRIKAAVEQGQKDAPELRKAIRDDLIKLEVIVQEAVKLKLGPPIEVSKSLINTPVGEQNIFAQQSALVGAFVQNYTQNHPVTEGALQQEYENLKNRVGNQEYKVAHILLASENEAISIAKKLKQGQRFDKLAKEKSKDPGSSDQGGDLGWANPNNFVQPFGDAIQTLAKGEISAPVQTQYGWHIIKLEDTRELKVPSYAEVKPNLEKRLQQQAIQEAIKSLRANARIE